MITSFCGFVFATLIVIVIFPYIVKIVDSSCTSEPYSLIGEGIGRAITCFGVKGIAWISFPLLYVCIFGGVSGFYLRLLGERNYWWAATGGVCLTLGFAVVILFIIAISPEMQFAVNSLLILFSLVSIQFLLCALPIAFGGFVGHRIANLIIYVGDSTFEKWRTLTVLQ